MSTGTRQRERERAGHLTFIRGLIPADFCRATVSLMIREHTEPLYNLLVVTCVFDGYPRVPFVQWSCLPGLAQKSVLVTKRSKRGNLLVMIKWSKAKPSERQRCRVIEMNFRHHTDTKQRDGFNMSQTRLMAAGRIRSVTICKLLSANVYNYSGSKLEIGGRFAYQTMLRRNSGFGALGCVYSANNSLIGKIIFQLLWICRQCVCVCV